MAAQRLHVLGSSIALVAIPTVLRVVLRSRQHHAVAPFLGYDRGGGDGRFDPVATHDGASRPAPFGAATMRGKVAVDQYLVRIAVERLDQPRHSERHRTHRGHQYVDPVNLHRFDYSDAPCTAFPDLFVEHRTAFGSQLL